MRHSNHTQKEAIENEAKVLAFIQNNGPHDNIIHVLEHGRLRGSYNIYFIDMELGDITLAKYISCSRRNESLSDIAAFEPIFIYPSSSCHETARVINAYFIGIEIANGLEFLHCGGYVHRDLKPSNGMYSPLKLSNGSVLYRRSDTRWKLTDFGLCSEGTSQRAVTTVSAKGTTAYRAPEMLRTKPTFTNKVDIWNLGTILYELVAWHRPFDSDFHVQQYDRNSESITDLFESSVFPEGVRRNSKDFIRTLLQPDPERRPDADECIRSLLKLIAKESVQFLETPNAVLEGSSTDGAEFIKVWEWLYEMFFVLVNDEDDDDEDWLKFAYNFFRPLDVGLAEDSENPLTDIFVPLYLLFKSTIKQFSES
jgi:serine/threonine protein kinase